ncbi:MAG: hypothetical protein IT559_06955 [Alphaproteobacteria bacterium]|nr:hypothetical protein [Alphaproteobacteria bacterium]
MSTGKGFNYTSTGKEINLKEYGTVPQDNATQHPASQDAKATKAFKHALRSQLMTEDMARTVNTLIALRDIANGAISTEEGYDKVANKRIETLLSTVKNVTGDKRPSSTDPLSDKQNIAYLQAITEIAYEMHDLIMRDEKLQKDFPTVWNMGRLLHNLGKPQDALPFIKMSEGLEPYNTKVMARKTEILADVYEDNPTVNNALRAVVALGKVADQENSDYVDYLEKRVIDMVPAVG